jgi:hypothetical protein
VAIGVQAKDVNRTVLPDRWTQLNGKGSGFAQLASRGDIWFEELACTFSIEARSKCIPGGASTIALKHVTVWSEVAVIA